MKKESKFIEVICRKCGNKQVVFGKSTSNIKCDGCGKLLTVATGGKAKVKTLVRDVLK